MSKIDVWNVRKLAFAILLLIMIFSLGSISVLTVGAQPSSGSRVVLTPIGACLPSADNNSKYECRVVGDGDIGPCIGVSCVHEISCQVPSPPWANPASCESDKVTPLSCISGPWVNATTLTCDINKAPLRTALIVFVKVQQGAAKPNDFTLHVLTAAGGASTSEFRGTSEGTTVIINPGEYSVNEDHIPGYKEISTSGCHGTAIEGQTIGCTFINSGPPPQPGGKLAGEQG